MVRFEDYDGMHASSGLIEEPVKNSQTPEKWEIIDSIYANLEKIVGNLANYDSMQKKNEIPLATDIGKVVWAKLTGFPWWPCLIGDNTNPLKKSKIFGIFLGDKIEHNWFTDSNILEYKGLGEFKSFAKLKVS
jgi:hypothetical protein